MRKTSHPKGHAPANVSTVPGKKKPRNPHSAKPTLAGPKPPHRSSKSMRFPEGSPYVDFTLRKGL